MNLIAFSPSTGLHKEIDKDCVRVMVVSDPDNELAVGHHATLKIFNHVLTNVDVVWTKELKYVCIKDFEDIRPEFDSAIQESADYKFWMGDSLHDVPPKPSSDDLIAAHIFKSYVPDFAQDFDAFVATVKAVMDAHPAETADLSIEGEILVDANGPKYDLVAMYQHTVMVGETASIVMRDGMINLEDSHLPECSVEDWLIEHNKTLALIAAENDMLAFFISFMISDNQGRDCAYYLINPAGTVIKRPVYDVEFTHLAVHNIFPKVTVVKDSNNESIFRFDYYDAFSKKYHDLRNHTPNKTEARQLVRFI